MIVDAQIRSLQNFADKFNLTVKYYQFEDKRKKMKFVLYKDKTSINHPMNYNETNIFLLGVENAKKFNL